MGRPRINKDVPEEVTPKVETPVEETQTVNTDVPVEETPVKEEVKFPQVSANGKFQFVQVEGGFVVYNPLACRVSGIITLTEASDIVRRQNIAAHIKG